MRHFSRSSFSIFQLCGRAAPSGFPPVSRFFSSWMIRAGQPFSLLFFLLHCFVFTMCFPRAHAALFFSRFRFSSTHFRGQAAKFHRSHFPHRLDLRCSKLQNRFLSFLCWRRKTPSPRKHQLSVRNHFHGHELSVFSI